MLHVHEEEFAAEPVGDVTVHSENPWFTTELKPLLYTLSMQAGQLKYLPIGAEEGEAPGEGDVEEAEFKSTIINMLGNLYNQVNENNQVGLSSEKANTSGAGAIRIHCQSIGPAAWRKLCGYLQMLEIQTASFPEGVDEARMNLSMTYDIYLKFIKILFNADLCGPLTDEGFLMPLYEAIQEKSQAVDSLFRLFRLEDGAAGAGAPATAATPSAHL